MPRSASPLCTEERSNAWLRNRSHLSPLSLSCSVVALRILSRTVPQAQAHMWQCCLQAWEPPPWGCRWRESTARPGQGWRRSIPPPPPPPLSCVLLGVVRKCIRHHWVEEGGQQQLLKSLHWHVLHPLLRRCVLLQIGGWSRRKLRHCGGNLNLRYLFGELIVAFLRFPAVVVIVLSVVHHLHRWQVPASCPLPSQVHS